MTSEAVALFDGGLRAMRRSIVAWSISLAALVAATVAFWPAFRGASGISEAIDSLPGAVVDAFGLQDFGTPAGFLRGNLYELFVPLLFSVAAVALVNGQTASDESAGRLELFLSQPVGRRTLFLARVTACLVGLAGIVVATVVVQLAMNGVVGLSIDAGAVVQTASLCGLLAAFHGSVAYLVACLWPRPSLVLGAGVTLTLGGYVVAALFPISSLLRPWKSLSPWDWALGGNPLEHGAEPWRYLALAVPAIVLALLGALVVERRDVAAA